MARIHSRGRSGRFSVPLLGRLLGMRKGNAVLNDTLAAYILQHTRHFQGIIEIGAGPGALSKSLLARFHEYIILDKSEFALDVSRRLSPGIKQIHADILEFSTRERFDAVFSMGLAEHFFEQDLHRLIIKHIEIASGEGSVFICVRAFNGRADKAFEDEDDSPASNLRDPRCEHKITAWLKARDLSFQKMYLDRVPGRNWFYRCVRRFNILLYKMTKKNLEKYFPEDAGRFVVFFIDKKSIKSASYFD